MEGHPIFCAREWTSKNISIKITFSIGISSSQNSFHNQTLAFKETTKTLCARLRACVCACDNRITGVICIEHLSRNWKWVRKVWRGFREISPHQSPSHAKTNTHTDLYANTHTPFPPDNMQMIPPEGHRGSVAVASTRNAFRCGRINQCSPLWPLSVVSHWIYSSTPRCHIKFLPPASEVSLSQNERVYGNINRAMRWEVLRAAFIREPHNTNGIIARWAGVEPDQCKTIITGWSRFFKTEMLPLGLSSSKGCWRKTLPCRHPLNTKQHTKTQKASRLYLFLALTWDPLYNKPSLHSIYN